MHIYMTEKKKQNSNGNLSSVFPDHQKCCPSEGYKIVKQFI